MAEDKDLELEGANDEIDVVTLTDEEGNETEFEVIGTIENGGKLYYALMFLFLPRTKTAKRYSLL